MKPYYYVYRFGHGAPKTKHDTLESAVIEAERLAESHPGEPFEILKCVALSRASKISTFWVDGECPPAVAKSATAQPFLTDGEGPSTVAKSATVQPDKDGWIARDPNDSVPYMHRGVRLGDGTEHLDCSLIWRKWRWTHSHGSKGEHITHYKPCLSY